MTSLYSIVETPDGLVPVIITVDIQEGIGLHLVGLADVHLKETLLRVATALTSIGQSLPGKKIVIQIAPSPIKGGCVSQLDLPIALGILIENGKLPAEKYTNKLIAGELNLDGKVVSCKCIRISEMLPLMQDCELNGILVPNEPNIKSIDNLHQALI